MLSITNLYCISGDRSVHLASILACNYGLPCISTLAIERVHDSSIAENSSSLSVPRLQLGSPCLGHFSQNALHSLLISS